MTERSWTLIEDKELTNELERIATEALTLLEEERRAITALDAARVGDLALRKDSVLRQLHQVVSRARSDSAEIPVRREGAVDIARRKATGALLSNVITEAELNALLLTDVVTGIAAALGMETAPTTYTARARLRGGRAMGGNLERKVF